MERTEYGDGGTPDQSTADRTAARAAYRLGRVHRQWDGAGRLTCERYDFTGSLQEKTRQVVEDSALLSPQRFRPDWTDPTTVPLESDGQTTVARYDALGRPYRLTLPRDAEGLQRTMVPSYNRAGALESIALARPGPAGTSLTETFVEHIAYDAQGQRILTIYGNGTMTRCSYDRDTLRLRRLRTEHVQQIGDHLYRPTGPVEQDFGYDHDLSGNVLRIRDRAPGSGVRNTPSAATPSTGTSATTRSTACARPPGANATCPRSPPGSAHRAAPTRRRPVPTPRPTATTNSAASKS